MTQYAILERRAWDGKRPVAEHAGCIIVAAHRLYGPVHAITGRGGTLSFKSVSDHLRRTGSVFIAGKRGNQGVIIEQVGIAGKYR